jgi:hypothetical protein
VVSSCLVVEPSGFVVVVVVVVEVWVSVVVTGPAPDSAEGSNTVSVGDTDEAGTTCVATSAELTDTSDT